jgi:protein TonB
MSMYEESSLCSGRKGGAFAAVILLHMVFGYALYSELAARIGKTIYPSPLNLTRMAEPAKEIIKPPPAASLRDRTKIELPPPEFPAMTPSPDPEVTIDKAPPDSPQVIPPPLPSTGTTTAARMDPKHPLRIGEDYYPDASRRANEEGRCVVQVTVAADGRIAAAAIQTSSGFGRLDQACLSSVRGQRMLPAMQNGHAIESRASIPIVWNLSGR